MLTVTAERYVISANARAEDPCEPDGVTAVPEFRPARARPVTGT